MTLTIELKPETEKRLAERARQKNLKIETFLEVLIEENLNKEAKIAKEEAEEPVQKKETYEEWSAKFHKWLDSHKDKNYPSIPDEALRRENMYED